MKIIAVTSPATDAGKTLLAVGLAESLTYQGYKTAFLDYDIAVGDSLRVFGLLNESRKPHPTITSWKNYPDLFQSALKVPTGTAIFPKPENQLEAVEEESVLSFLNQLSKSFDFIVADLGSDHRLPHWEAMIKMAHSAVLVVDCDEKALVRIKAFMQTNTRLPSQGWLLAVNSKEKTKTYSPKEIRRLIQDMNGVSDVLEVPYFKGVEEYTPKTFIPNSSFAVHLLGVLQENIEKTPSTWEQTTSFVETPLEKEEIIQESSLDPADNSIVLMLRGQIVSVQSLEEARQKLSAMIVDAVFLQKNIPHLCKVIKELRGITRCTLVVIGETDASLIEAGADECFPALTPEVITIVKTKAEKIRALWNKANTDELTGCYQRNFMSECFDHALQKYKEKGEIFSVIVFDLNDFKQINDVHGHNAGDVVLKAFGQHLKSGSRKMDIPVRSGGDEFILILPNSMMETAKDVARRIKTAWHGSYEFPTGVITVSFSMGMAQIGIDGETPEQILAVADQRMYTEKRSSKANYQSPSKRSPFSFFSRKTSFEQDVVLKRAEQLTELTVNIKNFSKPTVVVDADTGRLANLLGVDPNTSWQHDWRIGLAAEPAKVAKKIELFTLPNEEDIEWEERDFRALKDIVNKAVKSNKKVFIVAGDLYPVLKDYGF